MVVIGALATASVVARADEPTMDPPAFLAEWAAGAQTAAGDRITPEADGMMRLQTGGASYPFAELVQTHANFKLAIRLSFAYPLQASVRADLKELNDKMRAACSGGELTSKAFDHWSGEPQMTVSYRNFSESGLVGYFECILSDQHRSFAAEVFPAAAFQPHFPFGRQWNIGVQVVFGEVLRRSEQRFDAYRKKTDELRASLAPGSKVQVSESELPGGDETGSGQRGARVSACALVIEVKGPLAQVQVQRNAIYVPIEKLFPQGERLPIQQLRGSSMANSLPQMYCGT